MALLVRVLVFGILGYVAYRFLFPSSPIVVTMTGDGVSKCKGISESQKKKVVNFALEQLLEGESILIRGFLEERGRIRWVFPKNTSRALAQRFRNHMAS